MIATLLVAAYILATVIGIGRMHAERLAREREERHHQGSREYRS